MLETDTSILTRMPPIDREEAIDWRALRCPRLRCFGRSLRSELLILTARINFNP